MTVFEFGKEHPKTVLLLHGGGLSWWDRRAAAELLAEHYHVVLPILDGHGGSDCPFTSIEDNAARLTDYIDTHLDGRVTVLSGLSLGGQVAVEMLSRRPDICRCALIESALLEPMRLTHSLIRPSIAMSYGLIRQRWFAKLQAAYLGIPKELFNEYYRDTCRISEADMTAFLKASCSYAPKAALSQTTARVMIIAGCRETGSIRRSARLLHRLIPGSSMELLPGLRHGELSICQPKRFAQLLRHWEEEDIQ